MLNHINAIYAHLPSGELDFVRETERKKNITHSDPTKLKIVEAVLGGMSQKAASIKFKVSEYTVCHAIKRHKTGDLT